MKTTAYLLAVIAVLLNIYRSGLYLRPTNTDTQVYFGVHVVAWVLFSLILTWVLRRVLLWRHWSMGKEKQIAWVYVQVLYLVIAGAFIASTHLQSNSESDSSNVYGSELYTTADLSQSATIDIPSEQPSEDTTVVTVEEVQPDATVLGATILIEVDNNSTEQYNAGTGVYLGGGVILTNYHVINELVTDPLNHNAYGCVTISLNADPDCKHTLSLTPSIEGRPVGTPLFDAQNDLALLYLNQVLIDDRLLSWTSVPLAEFGMREVQLSTYLDDYSDLAVGDKVYTVGYPSYSDGRSVQTSGVVLGFAEGASQDSPVFVSDINIAPGNSGGPVFNQGGKLIGIVVACFLKEDDSCGAGIIIPLPTVHAWYTRVTKAQVRTWEGKDTYSAGAIPKNVGNEALCMLRANAHYDPAVSVDGCTCDEGYAKSVEGGDCDVHLGSP